MARQTQYYLSRIIKRGQITTESVIDAIIDPPQVRRGKFLYTFTDIAVDPAKRFVAANLSKYNAEGAVEVVEPSTHIAASFSVSNLRVAFSSFVFMPSDAVVAYQHVWNELDRGQFETVFRSLIIEKHERFFADCELDPITDLVTFVRKLSRLSSITSIEAVVYPPNPLFSPLWKSLRDYMRNRNAGEVRVMEKASPGKSVATSISDYAKLASDGEPGPDEMSSESHPPPELTDAAVLMAADGYGRAKVTGTRGGSAVVARTSDSQIGFRLPRQAEPETVYDAAQNLVTKIQNERSLSHE